jgi:hypothetical protein
MSTRHARGPSRMFQHSGRVPLSCHANRGRSGLSNRAHDGKVSVETRDASRPTPSARARGRQEPRCWASTPPPTQLPAQPKPRPVLHETLQSCGQAPSLPPSTAEIHASLTPHHFPTISKHLDELGLDCVKTRATQVPELGGFLALPMIALTNRILGGPRGARWLFALSHYRCPTEG